MHMPLNTLPPRRSPLEAIKLHEATYQVIAGKLDVAIKSHKPNEGVRKTVMDVLKQWPVDPDQMEQAAMLFFAAHHALAQFGDPIGNGRDAVVGNELIFESTMLRRGADLHTPSVLREARNLSEQRSRQAETLVDQHWMDIERLASTL